jgi:hydrogenase expression/formation protein HypC
MCLAIPGEVVAIDGGQADLATVNVAGVHRRINISLVDDIAAGDWVLVHVGFALSKIDRADALATMALLDELDRANAP